MWDLKLDSDNDLLFVDGKAALVGGADQIAQHIKNVLLTHRGEWFLNMVAGVDWLGSVLVKNPNLAFVNGELRSVIANVPGVKGVSVQRASFDSGKRRFDYAFDVTTSDGLFDLRVSVSDAGVIVG